MSAGPGCTGRASRARSPPAQVPASACATAVGKGGGLHGAQPDGIGAAPNACAVQRAGLRGPGSAFLAFWEAFEGFFLRRAFSYAAPPPLRRFRATWASPWWASTSGRRASSRTRSAPSRRARQAQRAQRGTAQYSAPCAAAPPDIATSGGPAGVAVPAVLAPQRAPQMGCPVDRGPRKDVTKSAHGGVPLFHPLPWLSPPLAPPHFHSCEHSPPPHNPPLDLSQMLLASFSLGRTADMRVMLLIDHNTVAAPLILFSTPTWCRASRQLPRPQQSSVQCRPAFMRRANQKAASGCILQLLRDCLA